MAGLRDDLSPSRYQVLRQALASGQLTPMARLRWATAMAGTDEELVWQLCQSHGARWYAGGSIIPEVDAILKSELDTRDYWRALDLMRGEPQTEEERVARSKELLERERGGVSTSIMDILSSSGENADDAWRDYQAVFNRAMADGQISPAEQQLLRREVHFSSRMTEEYREAKASVSQWATTIAVAIVGISATILTAGAAGPFVAALAAKLGGGVAVAAEAMVLAAAMKVGLSRAIQGEGYDVASAQALVDAVSASVEAGLNMAGGAVAARFAQGMSRTAIVQGVGPSVQRAFGKAGQRILAQGFESTVDGAIGGIGESIIQAIGNEAVWQGEIEEILGNIGTTAGVSTLMSAGGGFIAGTGLRSIGEVFGPRMRGRMPDASPDGAGRTGRQGSEQGGDESAEGATRAIREGQGAAGPGAGGVRGASVYELSGGGAKNQREFHGKIDELFLDKEGLIAHGAVKRQKTIDGKPTHILEIDGIDVEMDIRMMGGDKFQKASSGSVHGDAHGPATNVIRFENGKWRAIINVDRRLPLDDYNKVLGHELDEIAIIVKVENPKVSANQPVDATELDASIRARQEARVFKRGGSTNPADLSAHDQAAIREFQRLVDEVGANRAGTPATGPRHHVDFADDTREISQERTLQNMLREMGITGTTDPRLQILLARTNLSPNGRRWLDNYLYAEEFGGPFTPKLVDHLLQPNPKNITVEDWQWGGISGGHDTTTLRAMVDNAPLIEGHPQFIVEHPPGERPFLEISSSSGTTKVQNWQQKQYFPGRGYVDAGVPKTSVDDPRIHMEYMFELYEKVLKPRWERNGAPRVGLLIPEQNTDGIAVKLQIQSYEPLRFGTIFIDADSFKN